MDKAQQQQERRGGEVDEAEDEDAEMQGVEVTISCATCCAATIEAAATGFLTDPNPGKVGAGFGVAGMGSPFRLGALQQAGASTFGGTPSEQGASTVRSAAAAAFFGVCCCC
jgi:hypothetical protein